MGTPFSIDAPPVYLNVTPPTTQEPIELVGIVGVSILFDFVSATLGVVNATITQVMPPPSSFNVVNINRTYFPILLPDPKPLAAGTVQARGLYVTVKNVVLIARVYFERMYDVSLCGGKIGPNGRTLAKPKYRAQAQLILRFDSLLEHDTVKTVNGVWQSNGIVADPPVTGQEVVGPLGEYLFLQGVTGDCEEPLQGTHYLWTRSSQAEQSCPLSPLPTPPTTGGHANQSLI